MKFRLDKRIIIQKLTNTVNENGFNVEDWIDYQPVWSALSNLFGREFFAAKQVNSENTVRFKIRYRKDLDATINEDGSKTNEIFRIKFKNSIFNITFIDDIKFEHKFMEIKALSEVN